MRMKASIIKDASLCAACGGQNDASATACGRCGIALGDPFARVMAELERYDEGCEPRSLDELRCNCGKEDGRLKKCM